MRTVRSRRDRGGVLALIRQPSLALATTLLHASADMTVERQALGKLGEDLAVRELEARGYAIIERRYRTAHGEIDIVARDGATLVFVEVKARVTAEFGTAAEAVTSRKQRRLAAMAVDYIARRHVVDTPCRFDVVAIDDALCAAPRITVYPHAFDSVFGGG